MKNILKNITWALLAIIWVACSPDQESSLEAITTGNLVINVQSGNNPNARAVDTGTFGLTITNSEGRIVKTYELISQAPESINLPVGTYTVKVFSATEMPSVSFDSPYYAGETSINVVAGKTAEAKVTCTLQHLLLNVSFDASITDHATAYSTTISTAGGALEFAKDGKTSGYFERAVLLVTTKVTWNDVSTVTFSQVLTNLASKTSYDLVVKYEEVP